MLVSSLTELHTPCQTLSFNIFSKEQPLFKSVTGLNPVFYPLLTVTIVTVNMGWNTGFSLVTDWNKCCSLLPFLKLNVWQGVRSSVRLDTDIFIGTSVLNRQTLKTLFLQVLAIKMICSRKWGSIHFFSSTCGQNMSLYDQILLPRQCLKVPTCLLRPKPYLKTPSARQPLELDSWNFWENVHPTPCVTAHVSLVMCHLHLPHVEFCNKKIYMYIYIFFPLFFQ